MSLSLNKGLYIKLDGAKLRGSLLCSNVSYSHTRGVGIMMLHFSDCCAVSGMMDSLIEIRPQHLFRYPSEWDPRQQGRTKGGYLEGVLHLPKDVGDLRVCLSTYGDNPCPLIDGPGGSVNVHPTLIHVVRKGLGNRRLNAKEPVPNLQHWEQEFHVVNRVVWIRNKTSPMDESRNPRISEMDELFPVKIQDTDMTIKMGLLVKV